MPKIHWSEEQKGKPLDRFTDPKTGDSIQAFPTASVRFPSGSLVHGRLTTVEDRRIKF